MATDRQLDERISRWLEAEAPSELPDRVLRATFERTRRSRQHVGMRALVRRFEMPRSVLALGAAAVVVVVAVVGLNALGRPPGGSGGLTSPAPSPVTTPEASVAVPSVVPTLRPAGLLDEGAEFVLIDETGPGTVPMTVTIPAPDWYGELRSGILVKNGNADPPDGSGMIVFGGEDLYVFGDPCEWSTTTPDSPSTTVDAFLAAMAAQASRDASEPVDISVDGYEGKAITVHVPDDARFPECDQGLFGSWGLGPEGPPARFHQGPGQIDELWVLDVDGRLVVIDWSHYEGTPQADVDELRAIVESITFD